MISLSTPCPLGMSFQRYSSSYPMSFQTRFSRLIQDASVVDTGLQQIVIMANYTEPLKGI
jgi:hypothetical protein